MPVFLFGLFLVHLEHGLVASGFETRNEERVSWKFPQINYRNSWKDLLVQDLEIGLVLFYPHFGLQNINCLLNTILVHHKWLNEPQFSSATPSDL